MCVPFIRAGSCRLAHTDTHQEQVRSSTLVHTATPEPKNARLEEYLLFRSNITLRGAREFAILSGNSQGKICVVALISVVTSVFLTAAIMMLFADGIVLYGLIIAAIVPLLVSIPATIYIEKQGLVLKQAHDALHVAHMKLEEVHEEVKRLNRLDPMTGIFNREHFFDQLGQHNRKIDKGVVLIIDADHFKIINDRFGHPVGDKALHIIVKCIANSVRRNDVIGRIGGEEFGAFLPDTDVPTAQTVADRICAAVNSARFSPKEGVNHRLSVSIGGAIAEPSIPISVSITNADKYMYQAKQTGRDKAVVEGIDSDGVLHFSGTELSRRTA